MFIITTIILLILIVIESIFYYINNKKNNNISLKDPLTLLGNKGSFDLALEKAVNDGKEFCLLYCDLDNFKQLNDTNGHKAGDELLKFIAKIWKDINVCNHEVFRQGGDEFSVIAKCSKTKASDLAAEMLNKLENEKSNEFSYITASIGIVCFPQQAINAEDLKKYADTTMYEAKNSGKNKYLFFDKEIYKKIMQTYELSKAASQISEGPGDNFNMAYQPQWRIKDHKLVGFEALIRTGNDAQDFILAAENNGTIFDIDFKILKKVLAETKPIVVANPDIVISINVSGKHISLLEFYRIVYNIISEAEFPPNNIKFEITETSAVKNIELSSKKITKLKRLGVKIALDDFGCGYSSLRYLIDMNIDTLKIDKSFVDILVKDTRLVKMIIDLGHSIGCDIVAEGVEEEYQLDTLLVLGCDCIQGFLWGRPLAAEDALKLTKKCLLEQE